MSRKRHKLSLCVFIDGFGWEILQDHSFLEDVLTTRKPLDTVLGYSSTCIPTILTGKMPREHGHFAFFCYDPRRSPFGPYRYLSLLPRFITRRGRVRRAMSKWLERSLGYTGYFQIYSMPFEYLPLFDYSEKRDLYQQGGINSGVPTIFDFLRSEEVPFHLSDWRAREEDNFLSLEKTLQDGRVDFAYLYLGGLDGVLHAHGTQSPEVAEKIAWYDRELRRLVDVARANYQDLRLFVFSDHGLADIHDTCDLMTRVDSLGLRFGVDYAAAYDSTMARFWFMDPSAKERVLRVLEAEPRGRVLSDRDLKGYGCDFPEAKFGELIFLLDPGVLLCPSFMGEKPIAAMHGYAPEHKDSLAMFATSSSIESPPRRLDDLYGLMQAEVQEQPSATP